VTIVLSPTGGSADHDEALDRLVTGFELITASSVDSLQVAASLESIGITDQVAHDRYGHHDVFALARELRARWRAAGAPPGGTTDADAAPAPDPFGPSRVVHGFLYLLPAMCLPAVLALLDLRDAVIGLLVGGALGWVWTAASSWVGYRLVGAGKAATAATVVLRASLAGLVAALVAGSAVLLATGSLLAGCLCWAVTAYQLATMALFFLEQRTWIFWTMWPSATAGVAYLVTGEPAESRRLVAVATAIGLTALLGVTARSVTRATRVADVAPNAAASVLGTLPQLPRVVVHAALSAVFLLTAQAAFLFISFDAAVALVGLIATMGFVEWRAAVVPQRIRRLLPQLTHPHELRAAVPRVLAREVVLCGLAAGLLSVVVCIGLAFTRGLSTAGVVVAVSAVPLSAAYLLTFAHTNLDRYAWAVASLLLAVLVQVGLGLTPQVSWPEAFLVSSVVLLTALATGLVARPAPARSYQ
jgi:hypothetical protein